MFLPGFRSATPSAHGRWQRKQRLAPPVSAPAHIERLTATGCIQRVMHRVKHLHSSSQNRHQYRRAHRAGDGAASAAASRNGNDPRSRISDGHKEGKPSAGSEQVRSRSRLSFLCGFPQDSSRTRASSYAVEISETSPLVVLWYNGLAMQRQRDCRLIVISPVFPAARVTGRSTAQLLEA